MPLIDSFYGSGSPARPVTGPATTATTRHRHALVEACGQRPAIDDCLYRMLQPHEIQRVMAFADDYRVLGSQRQKVRQLGNAVTPPVSHMLVERKTLRDAVWAAYVPGQEQRMDPTEHYLDVTRRAIDYSAAAEARGSR